MNAAIFAFTRRGTQIELTLAAYLQRRGYCVRCFTMPRYIPGEYALRPAGNADACDRNDKACVIFPEPIIDGMHSACAQVWESLRLLICIGASGIAVRLIAPFLRSKLVDPAVLCIDERGRYVIPLCAGHIGGANAMAVELAKEISAQAIVTTGTDVNGLWAVDEWAARHEMNISSLKLAKSFAAKEVDGEAVGLYSEFPLTGKLPPYMVRTDMNGEPLEVKGNAAKAKQKPNIGVAITLRTTCSPFAETVTLSPRIVHLGIGCRRNTPEEHIAALADEILKTLGIAQNAICGIASIDVKANEQGLLDFAGKRGLKINFYSADELLAVSGAFTSSAFVRKTVGVDNVCERAAVKSSGGALLLRKTARNGVTIALAVEKVSYNLND